MTRQLFQCPCCGAVGATSDLDLEWFDLPELEEIQTEFDPDTYDEAPEAAPRREQPYQRGDEHIERINENTIRETHVAGARTGGLVVETMRNEPLKINKPQTRANMQELPTFKPCRAPKRQRLTEADAARAGLEVFGDDPSSDYYEGLSGQALHQEQLLQSAYEQDVRNRGFNPQSPII